MLPSRGIVDRIGKPRKFLELRRDDFAKIVDRLRNFRVWVFDEVLDLEDRVELFGVLGRLSGRELRPGEQLKLGSQRVRVEVNLVERRELKLSTRDVRGKPSSENIVERAGDKVEGPDEQTLRRRAYLSQKRVRFL